MEIRQEDLGKMMLKEAPPLDMSIFKDVLANYFRDTKNSMYLLYSRELNYFTVFKNQSLLAEQSAEKFIEFADESTFGIFEEAIEYHQMNEIVEIEYSKSVNSVELWIGEKNPKYFQLMHWDDSTVII